MTKEKLKQEFEELLIGENMFSQVMSSILIYEKQSFDEYLSSIEPYYWVWALTWTSESFRILNNKWRNILLSLDAINLDLLCELDKRYVKLD